MNKQYFFGFPNVQSKTVLATSILAVLCSATVFAEDNVSVLPTITVKAAEEVVAYKSGNMDIPRTEDDVQAYTMIEREEIERSGVTTVTQLLSKVLPMATSTNNSSYFSGTSSQINLRGLGTSQTLVLINGRRSAGTGNRGTAESTDQPNLNNIPLAAIERIEVLPTSAAAIYGSGAIGGVINVILRKDYVGTEVDFRYANTTDSKQPVKSVNLVSGFALEDGRTNVMITASKKDQDSLLSKERQWMNKARANILKNNPNAIYGAGENPPAGNLTNIRSKDGTELMPGWGSSIAHIPTGWDGNTANLGQGYALGLADGVSGWSGDGSILYDTTTESVGININRDFTDRLNVFLDAGYDREEGWAFNESPHGYGVVTMSKNNPKNPFGKDILVNFPIAAASLGRYARDTFETTQKKVATGFTFELTPKWMLSAEYAWSKSDIRQQYVRKGSNNPKAAAWNQDTANNLIDFLQDYTSTPTDMITKYWNYPINNTQQTLQDMSIRANGPIANWYAGDINLATGIEHRRYESEGFAEHGYVDNPWIKPAERKTNSSSLYAELNVPVIAPEINLPFAKLLDVQLATRYEDFEVRSRVPQYVVDSTTGYRSKLTGYSDSGKSSFDAITPTVGFRFAPNDQIMFRASYSEGFVTPTVSQIGQATFSQVTGATLKDPVTGKTVTTYESISGGNPNLTPESSKSVNAGIVLTPELMPDLRLSVDYYQIKKDNNITSVNAQYILDNQNLYANRITRDKNTNEVTSIDTTSFNALGLKTSGIDTNLNYRLDTAIGETQFSLGYTYVDEYKQQHTLTAPEKDFVSLIGSSVADPPLKHRANASIYLQASDIWGFGWAAQYYGSYDMVNANAILNQTGKQAASLKIEEQIYHDVFARARFPVSSLSKQKLDFVELGFGVQNLFNDYTVDMSGTQGYLSKYSDPKGRNYYLNLKLTF